jgi:two-component system, LytTR family, sensor kinase
MTSERSRIRPWMFVAAIWLWPAIFSVVTRIAQSKLQGWDPAQPGELLFVFFDWFAYAAVTPLIFKASARWPVTRAHIARRFLIHLALALLFCVAWALAGKLIELALAKLFDPPRLSQMLSAAVVKDVASWILTTIPFGVVVYTTVAGMAHAITYFTEARDRDLQMARLNEQLAGARYAALQAQVNPHFLFNTLNTIAVLVRDGDRAGAVRIVELLADVLRRTTSQHRASEVALEHEMDLVRQYLAIEQARFSDRLRVELDVDAALGPAAVPSFAVQHLVENAVRHGIARREDAGRVRVAARREGDSLEIAVTDDGPGIGSIVPAAGHGIENTRERLRALYGDRASLEVKSSVSGGTIAILRLPWRALE